MNKLIAIAINNYSDPLIPDLNNCVADVNAVIDILTMKYQFETTELFSSNETTTLTALYHNLYDQLINAMEEDSILIYYAGHGEYHPILGTSYWMCSDTQKNNITTWFNIAVLNSFLKASPAKHIALISDSCFSGAIFQQIRGGGAEAFANKISRQALTSGGLESVADGTGGHSLFNLSVQHILNENQKPAFTFSDLAEKVIMHFDRNARQTPEFGALQESGHKGGTFILNLQDPSDSVSSKDIQLRLELPKEVKMTSDIKVPFFNQNARFRNTFVNGFIQSLGYSIIKEIREFILEDLDYTTERSGQYAFHVEVNYGIEYFDDKLLSIQFSHYSEMGGIHPNYYFYALNFAFSPERVIPLYEILDQSGYLNLRSFLESMISQYGQQDNIEILKRCLEEYDYHDLPYSFRADELTIYWHNCLPHAFKALGELKMPIRKIDKEAGKIFVG